MYFRRLSVTTIASIVIIATASVPCFGQHRPFAPVPPTLEIEVLDPGVNSNGNPAVVLNSDGTVDIPPVVLVHRYYYSGDRSFQGPMLPGGPSILVLNHPKTGERIYVSAQMMPGAPRVTYTKKGITYQYEKHATLLEFGIGGDAKIKYRSGLSVTQKVGKTLHLEQIYSSVRKGKVKTQRLSERAKTSLVGITAEMAGGAKTATLPISNLFKSMPFGQQLFGGDMETYLAEKAAVYRRDTANSHAEKRKKLDELSIPTNR